MAFIFWIMCILDLTLFIIMIPGSYYLKTWKNLIMLNNLLIYNIIIFHLKTIYGKNMFKRKLF